eukprot:Protomagalhaensia_sp_Gyna_25__604@NODE_1285_length_1982_cov_46_255790_g1025_i0_p3_GENE_NODE_1285_length_1982_cov_46_255790_g1025_i0NODE_1285_length_1982_cov_46_255790_g1025_i0_p3_ORF_typecomplete_len133_score19_12SelR/PF01641_18/4_2e52YippeeMis18/PF03226_14/0_0056HECT_2/PF09814_9/1_5e02HECT_2/PF09814_9/0_35_NODE_1285_length_1982_cov_46_255790_g1025_i09691367
MNNAISLDEWTKRLDPDQYQVCRLGGTEPPFSGEYCNTMADGIYQCVCCQAPLFDSQAKFKSRCGWPSFSLALNQNAVIEIEDSSHGMIRTEVKCRQCDAHLGHVFPDGPPPGHLRYCINSVCLKLVPRPSA